ncbi:MAG: hypothetical protein WD066_03185 [Planctomycetaceae bacterium]
MTPEALALRDAYISFDVLSPRWLDDAGHVAAATVAQADAIVSWNFRHIVRLDRMKGYNEVNARMGYRNLFIITPAEVPSDEGDIEDDDNVQDI